MSTAPTGTMSALERLRQAKAFILDMDGVLYRGEQALPGVNELLNALALRGRRYMLATNNSTASPAEYVAKLARMGIAVPEDAILTSGTATRGYLRDQVPAGSGIYVIGMPALREQIFAGTSFRPVQFGEEQPAAVVAGLDFGFSYDKLKAANAAIRGGAVFIATNPDATLPTERGLLPGTGSIVAAITTASGRAPTVIGKPEPLILEQALDRLGVAPDEAVNIGDRLDTDILAGQRAGILTVLVLTGVSTRAEIADAPARPDLVFSDLPAIVEALVGNE